MWEARIPDVELVEREKGGDGIQRKLLYLGKRKGLGKTTQKWK